MGLSDSGEHRINGLYTGDCERGRRLKGTQGNLAIGASISLHEEVWLAFHDVTPETEEGDERLPLRHA
jgi:hypothetical protein